MKTNLLTTAIAFMVLLISCKKEAGYDATGIFEATAVTISAETAGRINSISPEEGDSVFTGQVLARIDSSTLMLQRSQVLAEEKAIASSRPDISAQAAALRSRISHAQGELERQARLLADGATTQKNYDDAASQVKVLDSELTGLLSQLGTSTTTITDRKSAARYQAEQISEQIGKCTVRSPLTGTILIKYAQEGEYAIPGKPLYKIANLNDIYLRSYFTANQLAGIKIGQKVKVIADFGGEEQYEYPGTITWIAEESEFTPKSIQTNDTRANLVYAVKVRVKNDGRLKMGQYGEVKL